MFVYGFNGHSRAYYHQHKGAGRTARCGVQHVLARTYHGYPAVCTQAAGNVVAIYQARLLGAGNNPARVQVWPKLKLLFGAALNSFPCYRAPQHERRWRQVFPGVIGKVFDLLKKFSAVRQQLRPRARVRVTGPFQPCIADINC